jgi:hypothetical protein
VYKPTEANTEIFLDTFNPNTRKSNYITGSHFNHIYAKKSEWSSSFGDNMASPLFNTKVTFLNNLNNLDIYVCFTINVDSDAIGQLLIINSVFVKYLRKMGIQ